MHQCAEIFLHRKKKVYDSFRSNTYRIFDENIPDRLDLSNVYEIHSFAKRDPTDHDHHKTHNIPQPYNIKFIRSNVKFLNAPISHMETESTKAEQWHWWPNKMKDHVGTKAPYSKASTQRQDYQAPQQTHTLVRHGRNLNRAPASGIISHTEPPSKDGQVVPTLNSIGNPKVSMEHKSFIHQNNSRLLIDQRCQEKRHRTFVRSEPVSSSPGRESTFLNTEGSRSPVAWIGGARKDVIPPHFPLLSPQQKIFNSC
ncbi:hypothetical protein UPYG_G00069310 [Umbra pygmaea]|uniref:Uncharacterized protein n=1 Tax=Umbra pygmaea TaxID=75934 RepID=A0ABD0XB70_UMBPY